MFLLKGALVIAVALTANVGSDVDTLDCSVVTASRLSGYVPNQRLDGEQLEKLSTTTVADALKYFAGVQIKDYGGLGGQKTVNVRSLGTQHTGVYLDGVRITNCQNGTVDLGKYSLSNMESIEVYNSNKVDLLMTASEYASASTLYLTTRRPEKTETRAKLQYGSFNTSRAQVYSSYRNRFFGDVEIGHSSGKYPFEYHSQYEDTTGVRKNSDITLFRAEGGFFTDHIKSHLYAYSSERGLPGGIVKRLSDKYGDIGRESDINTFAQVTYSNHWNNVAFKYNVRYAYDYLHANTNFVENQFVRYDNRYIQQDLYNGAVVSCSLPWVSISCSTDFRLSDLNCNVYGMSYVGRLDSKTVSNVNFHWKGLQADASCLYTFVKDFSAMKVADPLNRFTPSIHVSYSNQKDDYVFTTRAFYKTIFRAPTLNDLYYTHVGRRNLKPEYTSQVDVGISISHPKFTIQCDYYHNDVWDKIICVPNGGAYDWKMMNRGFVATDGVDFSSKAQGKYVSFTLTGTYQDVRDLTDPEDEDSYNHEFLYSPKWSASAILSFNLSFFTASLSHMYCSKRYWTYASADDILAPYHCTDFHIHSDFKHVKLILDINNVFDVHYELIQRWPLPGRSVTATIEYKF